MTEPLLSVRALAARYGPVTAIEGIDFDLKVGEVLALIGSNGAGKTTTLRAISRLIQVEGRVAFAGSSLAGMAPDAVARLGIAHVPEGRGTFRSLTVEENLRVVSGGARHSRRSELQASVFRLFPPLAERRTQMAGTLSGGEQQMLAIGRAMMLAPRLMLLDEPSFGLAPRLVADVFAALRRLREESGVAMIIVEQNADLALGVADRALLLESGRVASEGDAKALRGLDAVRRAYLGG